MKVKIFRIDRSDFLALGLLTVLFFFWSFLLVKKYLNFGYYDWDLAFFHQATWNILHGSSYSSLFDVNFFGNHSNLIVFLCLPLYALIQHPLTLVFLKLFSFFGGAYILYLLAKEKLGGTLAALLMFLYCFYTPNMFGLIYEFDYESLSPVFLFGLIYFFEKKLFKQFILTAFGLMLIKENMPFIVMTFSIYALFSRGRSRILWALIPFILASGMFYILTYIFIPFCRGQATHPYLGLYSQLGGSTPLGVILSIATHPWQILPFLLTPVNINFLFELFSPLILLPFLSPHVLFLILPVLFQHILSRSATEHYIYYQYALTMAPFLYWASVKTLIFLKPRVRFSYFYLMISLMAAAHVYSLRDHQPGMIARLNLEKDHLNTSRWEMVKSIPKEAAVISSFDFLAELSGRKDLYAFYKIHHGPFQDRTDPFLTPKGVVYALIDFEDIWLHDDFNDQPQETVQRVQKFFSANQWSVERAAEHIILFKKGEGEKLIETFSDEASVGGETAVIDDQFSLTAFEVPAGTLKSKSFLPLTFTWHSYQDIKETYELVLFLTKDGKVYVDRRHQIGYLIYPTLTWKKDETIKERFWLYIPDLEEGQYTLEIGFIDRSYNRKGVFGGVEKDRLTPAGTYPLAGLLIEDK